MIPIHDLEVGQIMDAVKGGLDVLSKVGDLFYRDPERVAERQKKRDIRQEGRERRRARRRYRRWVKQGEISHYQQQLLVDRLAENHIRYTAPEYEDAPAEEE